MMKRTLPFLALMLLLPGVVSASTIYVDIAGSDTPACGSSSSPCRTIEYAAESRSSEGDIVSINEGVYSEDQIAVPERVNLTSTGKNAAHVTIVPASTHDSSRRHPLILFDSPIGTNNPFGLSLSYVTLDGDGTANTGPYYIEAINVHDRDNVEISHCVIRDFYKTQSIYGSNVVVAQSSKKEDGNQEWWYLWPSDTGPDGDDTNIDSFWPGTATEHVENFQFHDNIMRNCGNKVEDRSHANIGLWMVKDSDIYNNDLDSSGCPGTLTITNTWPGVGRTACLWNVDFFNNSLKADLSTSFLGWYSIGTMEMWLMRGGCEFYENNCNQGWSLTRGKNTIVRDNVIIGDPHSDCDWFSDSSDTTFRGSWGVELDGQSFLEVYNNYIEGTANGFKLGSGGNRDYIVRTGRVYNNFIIDTCRSPFSISTASGSHVLDYKVYENTADGRYSTNTEGRGNFQSNCINVANHDEGSVLEVDFANNIFTDGRASFLGLGYCDGLGTNYITVRNTLYDTTFPNFWRDTDGGVACGTSISGSINSDSQYARTGSNAEYYMIGESSPAKDNGLPLTAEFSSDYFGTSRPQDADWDIGAHEYQTEPVTCQSLPGTCCQTGETCLGTLQPTSDCDTCCIGTCQPVATCQNQGYRCCESCLPGTEQPAYDSDCPGQICCDECEQPLTDCDGIQLLMHFDNDPTHDETPTHVYDFSGNGNNGTVFGAVHNPSAGMFGGAFEFVSDYITVAHNENLNNIPLTISLWVKSSEADQGDWNGIINKYPSATANGWSIDASDSGYYFYYFADNSNNIYPAQYGTPFGSASTEWAHLVVTINTSGAFLYHNGSFVMHEDWAGSPESCTQAADLEFGRINNGNLYFRGLIDDVAIWNRALTHDEIQGIFSSGSPISCQIQAIHRADNNPLDGCIEEHELIPFIDFWKYNSTAYPMSEMMEAVVLYYIPGAWCN